MNFILQDVAQLPGT